MRRRFAILLSLCAMVAPAGIAGAQVDTRIVGPDLQTADPAEWPFITPVYLNGAFGCGGSVVSPRWVLTAGHCRYDFFGQPFSTFGLYPGAFDRTSLPQGYTADAVRVHPEYSAVEALWDFTLLRLPSATAASPVAVPAPADDPALAALRTADPATGARNGRIAGWGDTTDGGSLSNTLNHTAGGIPILADSVCADPARYGTAFDPASMVCAGGYPTTPAAPDAANDTCQGDSGGPLAADVNGRRVIVGVTSWGNACGDPQYPGVYANVQAAREWICDTVTSPVSITATAGTGSAAVAWAPGTAPCPWRDPVVEVVASPGGARATAVLSSGGVTVAGLASGTTYDLAATVVSSAGATPPAATTSVTIPTPPPTPSPAPVVPAPCTKTFFQQDARTSRTQAAPDGTQAVRVVSRVRIYEDAPPECRTNLTFIFRNRRTGARLTQLPGSTLGYRRLVGRDFSAPVISWPPEREFRFAGADPTGLGRRDARLVLVSYLKRTAAMPAQSNVDLVVVRRVPGDPTQPASAANPEFAQKNTFGIPIGWAVVS